MSSKSKHILVLILPIIVGMVGGAIVANILCNRAIQEIERTWKKPANVAIPDLGDVLAANAVLGVSAGTLLGLFVGVFLYALVQNRYSEPGSMLQITNTTGHQ